MNFTFSKMAKLVLLVTLLYIGKEAKNIIVAMVFTFNTLTAVFLPLRIIATRKNSPAGPVKRFPELEDVLFPEGLMCHSNKLSTLYCAFSDTKKGRLIIPYPFN